MEERQNLAAELGRGGSGATQGEWAVDDAQKRQTLFEIGAPVDGCYWLTEDVLKVSTISDHGAERILSRESPSLSGFLTQPLVARLRQTAEDVTAASFLSLRSRIARALLEFTRYIGVLIALPDHFVIRELRQEDIAARASVARENVSRILSEWRRDKLIVPQTPSVYVVLKSQLEREASIGK